MPERPLGADLVRTRPSCPFCEPPRERIVAEDELSLTIRDGYPVSPGHTLVLPRRHIGSLFEATEAERRALWEALGRARAALERELRPDGYNLGINDGAAAGQTVMHLHVHLIPRYQGDSDDPRGGIRHCIPGRGYYHGGGPEA
jgi:diadenosine tetraphosphate (Ap4A) HIT family hydrolase